MREYLNEAILGVEGEHGEVEVAREEEVELPAQENRILVAPEHRRLDRFGHRVRPGSPVLDDGDASIKG